MLPSGAARAAAWASILPAAPGRLSLTTWRAHFAPRRSLDIRPMMSASEPAPKIVSGAPASSATLQLHDVRLDKCDAVKTAYRIRMAGIIDCSGKLVVVRA